MTTIHKHEMLGINYLISKGYKSEDIRINSGIGTPTGTPDLTTLNDNREWEVKRITAGLVIEFTSAQLCMDPDTNILIFEHNGDFIESIKFDKILKDATQYRSRFSFNLGLDDALSTQGHLGIDKCDYINILRRFGMFHRTTRTFEDNFSSLNIAVSTDTYISPDKDKENQIEDVANGTFIKLKDMNMGNAMEYYINDDFVGSSCNIFDDGDILTVRVAGSYYTKLITKQLKDMSNTVHQHMFGDKRSEFSFTLKHFPNSKCDIFTPVVFINDEYVGNLSDGDDLIIKVTGGSEINTLARCFEFAAAELQLERIVNTLRYINSERKHINSKSLIPRPDMIETEFVNKIKYMYNNALHNLMYIEYKEEQNNVTY